MSAAQRAPQAQQTQRTLPLLSPSRVGCLSPRARLLPLSLSLPCPPLAGCCLPPLRSLPAALLDLLPPSARPRREAEAAAAAEKGGEKGDHDEVEGNSPAGSVAGAKPSGMKRSESTNSIIRTMSRWVCVRACVSWEGERAGGMAGGEEGLAGEPAGGSWRGSPRARAKPRVPLALQRAL